MSLPVLQRADTLDEETGYSWDDGSAAALINKVMHRWQLRVLEKEKHRMLGAWLKWEHFNDAKKILSESEEYNKKLRVAKHILVSVAPAERSMDQVAQCVAWALRTAAFKGTPEIKLTQLFEKVETRQLRQSEPLMYQGEMGDSYYVVMDGEIGIFIVDEEDAPAMRDFFHNMDVDEMVKTQHMLKDDCEIGHHVATIGSGFGMGELGLLPKELGGTGGFRTASGVALESTLMLEVRRKEYDKCLRELHTAKFNIRQKLDFMSSLHEFEHWRAAQIKRLAFKLDTRHFKRGATFLDAGSPIDTLLFIVRGSVVITHPRGQVPISTLNEKSIIGTEAIISAQPNRSGNRLVIDKRAIRSHPASYSAQSDVFAYSVVGAEALKYFIGGNGFETQKRFEEKLDLLQGFRRTQLKQMRKAQERERARNARRQGHSLIMEFLDPSEPAAIRLRNPERPPVGSGSLLLKPLSGSPHKAWGKVKNSFQKPPVRNSRQATTGDNRKKFGVYKDRKNLLHSGPNMKPIGIMKPLPKRSSLVSH